MNIGSPRRIDLSLFDEELKTLINASAKIFPITQEQLDNDLNPENYEYGRIDNHIYRWDGFWDYIIADDINILWSEIKDKPTQYTPTSHTHQEEDITNLDKYNKVEVDTKLNLKADKTELHSHTNKTLLDSITQTIVDRWNSAVNHINDLIRHVTQEDKNKWDDVVNKADTNYVDTELSNKSDTTHNHDTVYDTITSVDAKLLLKSDITHNHDGAYYKKVEVDTKLGGKASLSHTHTDSDITVFDIPLGDLALDLASALDDKSNLLHTHTESDIIDLDKYNKSEVDTKLLGKSDTTHKHTEADISDLDKYTKLEVDNKLNGKSDTTHTHSELHTHVNKILLDKLVETTPNISYDLSNLQYIEDIKNGYTEGHAHSNLIVLNGITEIKVDGWDSAVSHISDSTKHITSGERTLWNTVSSKSPSTHNHDATYSPLNHNHSELYAPTIHTHDDRYFTKTEITTKLGAKSDTTHTHTEKADIGYVDTELGKKSDTSHTHTDKADRTYVDTELGKKVATSTFTGHTGSATIHVTQLDKDNWNSKVDINDIPLSLPASGGDSDTVGGYTVGIDVPSGAKFTDTIYTHPTNHSASMITESTDRRFVSDAEKIIWNAKSEFSGSYNDLSNKPTIPSTTNQLTNNSGFITMDDVPSGVTIGNVKPTDGSMWYKVIG